ncbi:protein kinase family protein [Marinactinospora rubrisoli]
MIEPGARLAGRYRLDELVSETSGATLWKATDETLARLVAVWTFAEGFPRTGEVVRAARAASRVADARVTQVFDADDSGPTAYVVEEWVVGQSLTELLAQGPLEPERAAGLIAEAAEAVAAANATGIYHLSLSPSNLMWSAGGAVKVTGIGVDAALRGITAQQPGLADAQGLGRLMYAALTARWPGGEQSGLRPAPVISGRPCEPSQIRAGIPGRLNDVSCRAAFQTHGRGGPLSSAQAIADALADVPRLVPMPTTPAAGPAPAPREQAAAREVGEPAPPRPAARPAGSRRAALRPSPSSSRITKALVGVVALLVFVAVVLGAWTLGSVMSSGGNEAGTTPQDEEEQQASTDGDVELTVLEPAGAAGFNPETGDDEHSDKAPNAIDGDPSTRWNTTGYMRADFGGLKSGVGLILDMGDPVEVHEATIDFGGGPYDFEILMGDQPEQSALTPAAEQSGASGEVTVKLAEPTTARYVVVWFTNELPPDGGGAYRGTINEVELRGNT